MWGHPLFDLRINQVDVIMRDVRACREAHPAHYIKLTASDPSLGRQTTALSFVVNRPPDEPGYRLDRTEAHDCVIRYRLHPYATDKPAGRRYPSAAPDPNGSGPSQ